MRLYINNIIMANSFTELYVSFIIFMLVSHFITLYGQTN